MIHFTHHTVVRALADAKRAYIQDHIDHCLTAGLCASYTLFVIGGSFAVLAARTRVISAAAAITGGVCAWIGEYRLAYALVLVALIVDPEFCSVASFQETGIGARSSLGSETRVDAGALGKPNRLIYDDRAEFSRARMP